MHAMRKCCGYYCAMIAVVGIFFYLVIAVMEYRRNQFVLYKLQFPEDKDWSQLNASEVTTEVNKIADSKFIATLIAAGLNVLCVIGCILQVKIGEKNEAAIARINERNSLNAGGIEEESKD